MAITSILRPVVQRALRKFIADKSTLANAKKFKKKFNPLTKEGVGGKFTTPQRQFIADEIGVDDYKLISQKQEEKRFLLEKKGKMKIL